MSVKAIGGDNEWSGERMDAEEVDQAVALLEEWIADIRAQLIRGFAIAGTGAPGIGGRYRTDRFMGAGANRTGVVGALHLLAHRLEAEINDEE